MDKVLEPARSLIKEVLDITQTSANEAEVSKEMKDGGELLKKYFYDTKNNKS